MSPIFKDSSQIIKTQAYHCYIMGGYLGEAIRNDRYRMVRWTKINDTKNKIYELYDCQNYFLETENITDKKSSIVIEMENTLNSYGKAVYPQ